MSQQIGVIGMAVMGKNLALNIANHGYLVSIYNRSSEKTYEIYRKNKNKNIIPYYTLKDFVFSLKSPRHIFLMVQSGFPTDNIISFIKTYLQKGDILIDGGNSFYKDTIRRYKELKNIDVHFIGAGISGGAQGALTGPAIMPGGDIEAYKLIAPILKNIAASSNGEPCVAYIGPDGSGHYVKMVHNGIEYGDMQLISEAYFLLKLTLNLNNEEISHIFNTWNQGELNSYLIEITKEILTIKDETGAHYLIDVIKDEAENKGTGIWTTKSALDLCEPLTLITESVFSRYISCLKSQRLIASKTLTGPFIKRISTTKKEEFIEHIRRALYLGKIVSYAQGFSLLKNISNKNKWNLQYDVIAKIFRSGCIIRAQFLKNIIQAYEEDKNIINLLFSTYFKNVSEKYQKSLREIILYSVKNGIFIPAFSSALSYYDGYRSLYLPANLIQAQRDYFGSHTYKRIDKEGNFHSSWKKEKK